MIALPFKRGRKDAPGVDKYSGLQGTGEVQPFGSLFPQQAIGSPIKLKGLCPLAIAYMALPVR
jgi:hypothetical protein